MDAPLAAGAHEQWADLNTRFHLAISRLAGMPMLQEMTRARLVDRWDRVRRYYFSGVLVHRAQQAQAEHRACSRSMERARPAARSRRPMPPPQPEARSLAYTATSRAAPARHEKRERHA